MKHVFSRIVLSELANINRKLVVEVSIKTKPNNEAINTALIGIISSSTGGMTNLSNASETSQKVLVNFERFKKFYTAIIIPSISDDGNIQSVIRKNSLYITYGSCNNFTQIFPGLIEIAGVEYTNIEITINFKCIKCDNGFNKIAGVIREQLI